MRRGSSPKPEPTIKRSNMQQMPAPAPDGFIEAAIQDVIVRDLRKFTDSRGWLTELFRRDEVALEFSPAMAYISSTLAWCYARSSRTRWPGGHFLFSGTVRFHLANVGQSKTLIDIREQNDVARRHQRS